MYHFTLCYFGAGYAEPYADVPSAVITPNCTVPDMMAGFNVQINDKTPTAPLHVKHNEQVTDLEFLVVAFRRVDSLMSVLRDKNLSRIYPANDILHIDQDKELKKWIRVGRRITGHVRVVLSSWTWKCCDEHFRVRRGDHSVFPDLYVGSAACLPQIPECNPHLSIYQLFRLHWLTS
jgi:hypothetical protein